MKKILFFTMAAFFATVAHAGIPGSSPTTAPDITPDMQVYTKAEAVKLKERDYAYHASAKEVREAVVDLKCQVGEDLFVTQCVVISEAPKGHGFGKAAAMTVLLYGKADGDSKPDSWVHIVAHFQA